MKKSIYSTINQKTIVLFLFILSVGFNSYAQELRGTILSEGEPLPGANVINLTT